MWEKLTKRRIWDYKSVDRLGQFRLDFCNILIFDEDYVSFLFLQEILESAGAKVHRSISYAAGPPYLSCMGYLDLIIVRNSVPLEWLNENIPIFKLEHRIPVLFISEEGKPTRPGCFLQYVDLVVDSGFDSSQIVGSVAQIIQMRKQINSKTVD